MKVWIDITNSPHVLFFAPIVRRLQAQGHRVTVTARSYAQTEQLLADHHIDALVVGRHRGRNVAAKAAGLAARGSQLVALGRRERFDVAAGHNSNDLTVAARLLRIPQVTMFDYEFAKVSHHLNLRLVDEIIVPDAIPIDRLLPYGIAPERIVRYPGLKEEYYLYDFTPDPEILAQLGVEGSRIVVVLRPAPEVTLYHRIGNPLVDQIVERMGGREDVRLVVLPRTEEQRRRFAGMDRPSVVVPPRAVDGLSLIAAADLVVGAGGTMNREAVALGTPVYTLFAGRMGAVDERLIAEGRLKRAESLADVTLRKKAGGVAPATLRDPQFFVDNILRLAAAGRRSRR
jgi:predicted glycosyltransferase